MPLCGHCRAIELHPVHGHAVPSIGVCDANSGASSPTSTPANTSSSSVHSLVPTSARTGSSSVRSLVSTPVAMGSSSVSSSVCPVPAWPNTAEKSEGVTTADELQPCKITRSHLGTLRGCRGWGGERGSGRINLGVGSCTGVGTHLLLPCAQAMSCTLHVEARNLTCRTRFSTTTTLATSQW